MEEVKEGKEGEEEGDMEGERRGRDEMREEREGWSERDGVIEEIFLGIRVLEGATQVHISLRPRT